MVSIQNLIGLEYFRLTKCYPDGTNVNAFAGARRRNIWLEEWNLH